MLGITLIENVILLQFSNDGPPINFGIQSHSQICNKNGHFPQDDRDKSSVNYVMMGKPLSSSVFECSV